MENATNGDAIVKMKLDECVSDRSDAAGAGLIKADDNDPNYSYIVDFNVLKVRVHLCVRFPSVFLRCFRVLRSFHGFDLMSHQ